LPVSILVKHNLAMPLDDAVLLLSRKLFCVLSNNLLLVESFEGADGSNVRIVVKEKDDDVIEAILKVVSDVENELGVVGLIFPDIVTQDEIRRLS